LGDIALINDEKIVKGWRDPSVSCRRPPGSLLPNWKRLTFSRRPVQEFALRSILLDRSDPGIVEEPQCAGAAQAWRRLAGANHGEIVAHL